MLATSSRLASPRIASGWCGASLLEIDDKNLAVLCSKGLVLVKDMVALVIPRGTVYVLPKGVFDI